MTKRMLNNINWLKAFHCCSKSEKAHLIKAARPEAVNALCDCIKNILNGTVPIDCKIKTKLSKKKSILRKLSDRKTKTGDRKKLLVQQGGGFLNSILAPVLGVLDSIL